MERESQPAHSGLTEALRNNIWRVNFYRLCQLLEQENPEAPPLGSTDKISTDPVRFRPWPGMGFPVSELKVIETDEDQPGQVPTVRTTFLGMYGVDSPLPTALLDDIAQHREGYQATSAFLDIFSHRILTQYYRIWRKYAYPVTFDAGGEDDISRCLLGLVGLGIPGTAEQVATPCSRFLALLGTLRLPTRNAEGIRQLVTLLAPHTRATVIRPDPVKVSIESRSGLGKASRVSLSQRATLGRTGKEACSRILLMLATDNRQEAQGWLPGGQIHTDLMVLLRVYMGYRADVRLRLTVPVSCLPEPRLGKTNRVQLGRTGVLGLNPDNPAERSHLTVSTGTYAGLTCSALSPAQPAGYRFG
ncbi:MULTISPECIES: type VI secretion system baseplate subunit TssG [Tatumella]|uniref:Type VI secretion system baseplate subunit TssG n=1 Tax=Tatumella punctata TaxID=399969 RepID=A0ABW1VR87_9GAMM|nr:MULTISPECIES: type VI secretion system baseplate subunit TssG [unclassified Tatumella]MBS0878487.1 type VI secretion system baseplate subunit TssG [Tatumella sp. JGM82]MBS0891980.1 type VI secretion system baseplate subunit TssG [Tatumella sp. JGM94]MBS0894722.1 type VI secretion system baseplate subunit TssG [Tatumella sp. JGM130]MBS0903098.1 type VI secretion system baseplate subunit TssG [Tatumella sp. JGM100]